MPANRQFGMDHPHYDWSPISTREVLRWPDNARVALCVIVNLEHMEWETPTGSFQSRSLAGGSVARPFPDYARLSHREYGHRIGVFRVLDMLEKYGIKPTVAMDAMTAANYPYLVSHLLGRDCEIIGHGVSVSRMINSGMSEEQEREYISESLSALTTATGAAAQGWLGPEYGESARTPYLLAEAGISYVCDWTNDEQPYPFKVPQGEILSLPIMLELDDVNAMADRKVPMDRYSQMLKESFGSMYEDGADNGRVMVLHLHPWLIGQPFRIGVLDEALGHMMRRQAVWAATGREITDWYRRNPPVG